MIKQSERRNKPRGGPGKAFRAGMSLIELFDMFPDEDSALEWFEGVRWKRGRYCGHCASIKTSEVKGGKPMPFWCADCRSYFSVKTGTPLHSIAAEKAPDGVAEVTRLYEKGKQA